MLPLGRTIEAGLFSVPNGSVYSKPGTEQFQTVYMQIYAWIGFVEGPVAAGWQEPEPLQQTCGKCNWDRNSGPER